MFQLGQELSPQQRLSKAVVDIMGSPKYQPLSGILMIGEKQVTELPFGTACTNGRDEWYDPRMVSALNDPEMRYLVLHECKHKMYRHLITWAHLYDINPEIAGQALDHVINLELNEENKDGFAVMPGGEYKGPADIRFRGMSSAQVFNILLKEQQGGGGGKGEGEGEGGGSGKGQGEGQGKGGSGGPDQAPDHGGFDRHDWAGAKELTEAEKHELERDIDEAIRQGALAAGKTGTGDALDLRELLKPQVNWREVLREFIQQTCAGRDYSTYQRPNRRYMSSGIIMPSGVSEQVGELILAIDMSGSTSVGKMRNAFLTECQEICDTVNPERVRMLYWDTAIAGEEVYEAHEIADMHKKTQPKGGGGTVVKCVADHIKDNGINAQAVVVLSDGDIWGDDHGNWTMPVLWVICDSPGRFMNVGKTLHVDSTLG